MLLLVSILALLTAFYFLAVIVENYFIKSLEVVSSKMKLSSDIAGATLMAAGSSAPELFVAILALFRTGAQQSIGAGTIVGSAIFNILVIIGASALYKRAVLTWQPVIRDLIFYLLSILLLLYVFIDGKITLLDAGLFVLFYAVYLFSFKKWKEIFPYSVNNNPLKQEQTHAKYNLLSIINFIPKYSLSLLFLQNKKKAPHYLYVFLLSIVLIGIFSYIMVESAVTAAHILNIPEVVIALTILAAGTSIPDLLSSVYVAKRGRGDMAVANAVGSNIFDIAVGLGIPWFITILITQKTLPVVTKNLYSSILLLFATVLALLFLLIANKWKIGRYAGVLLIAVYVFYILTQLNIISASICITVERSICTSF